MKFRQFPAAYKLYGTFETESVSKVQDIHRSILYTYIDDFAKYAKKSELVRLQKIFRSIPLVQGEKIKYSNISRDDKSADIRSAIDLLSGAGVVKIAASIYIFKKSVYSSTVQFKLSFQTISGSICKR